MAQRAIFSLFECKSTADRLKRCQLRSPVSAINIWWSAAILITPTGWPSTNVCSGYRPSIRNYLITIWCGSVNDSGDICHLCKSLRGWLLVPPFTRAFLKSPSSRGLSAIAELLVHILAALEQRTERSTLVQTLSSRHYARTKLSVWAPSFHTLYHPSRLTHFLIVTQSSLIRSCSFPSSLIVLLKYISHLGPYTSCSRLHCWLTGWLQTFCVLTVQRLRSSCWVLYLS